MTIVSVRFYYYPRDPRRELSLSRTHWGFAEWFVRRLKPLKEALRGPEAKGVDIVNFSLHENPRHVWRPNEWGRRANSFEYGEAHDLAPLSHGAPVENIKKLMVWASFRAAMAPWPQVRALSEVLARPLTDGEQASLKPFIRWPRGET
jgi:hypothetical protein